MPSARSKWGTDTHGPESESAENPPLHVVPPMENKKAQLHWTFQGRFATKSSTKTQKITQKYKNNKSHGGAREARPPWGAAEGGALVVFCIFVDDFMANLP